MSQHTSRQLAQPTDATAGPSSIACAQHVRRRRGFTLVELLTVVSIILLLTAVVIPIALPSLEGRQKREAARQLNSFIVGARTRARQTGRPVGVWLERYRDPTNENLVLDEM
jgi:prepilin-type N-terminal cleavage/methylation domain-containing protein